MISGNSCSGCFESPCSKPFIELDTLLDWTHWSEALEIYVMETTYEVDSGGSDVNFFVTLRIYRLV